MTTAEIEALKEQFNREYFRYLQDDGRREGYEVDFDTEFQFWLDTRNEAAA